MTTPYGLIFAGGAGERLGWVDKSRLRLGNEALLQRVAVAMVPCHQPLLVATGPANSAARSLPASFLSVPDAAAHRTGPLAGLQAALQHLRTQRIAEGHLVTAAVDTPFLPADYIARLEAASGTSAAYAAWGEDFYPTHAIWRIEALLPLDLSQTPSLKALLAQVGATRIDWKPYASENPFHNLNTLADLRDAAIRLRRQHPAASYSHKPR